MDKISNHTIVQALNGGTYESNIDCSDILNYHHDDVEPQECFSIVDADSSQQDAILLAKRGVSFVMQGPPGTGKSQTITNIIAELLADGKKVLFVAEKVAALDVVYKRLKQNGLGDFCLTLHSHNAKRREILDQLQQSMKLSQQKIQIEQEAFHKLYQLKEIRFALNQYTAQLHTIIMPLGKTIYQVNGLIAKYGQYEDVKYNPSNVEMFHKEQLAKCEVALGELKLIVEKSGYQQDNPWKGCILTDVTHEFRQQFMVDSAKLLEQIEDGLALFHEINMLLGTSLSMFSISNVSKLIRLCTLAERSPCIPYGWLNSDLIERVNHFHAYQEAADTISNLVNDIEVKCELLKNEYEVSSQFSSSSEIHMALQSATLEILAVYDQGILSIHADEMLKRFQTTFRSELRFLLPSYYKDRKVLLSFCKTAMRMSYSDMLLLLDKLKNITVLREFLEKQTEIESLRKNLTIEQSICEKECQILCSLLSLQEEMFDAVLLKEQLDWACEFYTLVTSLHISSDFVKLVCDMDSNIHEKLKHFITEMSEWDVKIKAHFSNFEVLFEEKNKKIWNNLPFEKIKQSVKACSDDLLALESLIDYRCVKKQLEELGIGDYLERAKEANISSDKIVPIFYKCFYRSWLDVILPKYPAVHKFRVSNYKDKIAQFKDLDKLHLVIAKATLTAKLTEQLPNFDSFLADGGEVALLRRELAKQRKFMPIRKLIASIPNLLPELKTCMMMSPLSVSTYLGNSGYEFDTVIFDEASQVRTEDAIGAIFRAKQAIITGDSKQLLPTDFFYSAISDHSEFAEDENGDVNDMGAYESLLDEAAILPTQTLLWHYRSKHEDLIAFSNAKIYHGNLITFPSAIEKIDGIGVEYLHVADGVYERGGKNGNKREAEKVAELVFEHFLTYPSRSLGIIAFSEVQQTVIEEDGKIKMVIL